MPVQTKAQQDLALAERLVTDVEREPEPVRAAVPGRDQAAVGVRGPEAKAAGAFHPSRAR